MHLTDSCYLLIVMRKVCMKQWNNRLNIFNKKLIANINDRRKVKKNSHMFSYMYFILANINDYHRYSISKGMSRSISIINLSYYIWFHLDISFVELTYIFEENSECKFNCEIFAAPLYPPPPLPITDTKHEKTNTSMH